MSCANGAGFVVRGFGTSTAMSILYLQHQLAIDCTALRPQIATIHRSLDLRIDELAATSARANLADPTRDAVPLERASDEAYLPHSRGDANNAILAAADYDFRLLVKRLRILVLIAIFARPKSAAA